MRPDNAARARTRAHTQRPAHQMRALTHAGQAQATPSLGRRRIKSRAIVANQQGDAARATPQPQPDMARMTVADGVGQALLRDAVQRRLYITSDALTILTGVIVRAQVELRLD